MMKRSKRSKRIDQRTVAGLLSVENRGFRSKLRSARHSLPGHTYIFCGSRNIATRFLSDAEAEGFTFGDGGAPTEKEYSDIFAINPDFTISYTGWAGHVLFHNGKKAKNVIRIDYGRYISGGADYVM